MEIMSISGCAAIAAPTSALLPFNRLKTPGGRPASCTSCAKSRALRGDSSLGLRTTVQPAAMAGATFLDLVKRLCEMIGGEQAYKAAFFTSGAEAVENAVKIDRAYTQRSAVIAFRGGFQIGRA